MKTPEQTQAEDLQQELATLTDDEIDNIVAPLTPDVPSGEVIDPSYIDTMSNKDAV